MYRFYRLDKDERDNDVLTNVDTCAIQADRIPPLSEKYDNVLFHLGMNEDGTIRIKPEYSPGVPADVIAEAEKWINAAEDKIALPTYFYDHILLNGVERIPHLHLVYIAESEEAVRAFISE